MSATNVLLIPGFTGSWLGYPRSVNSPERAVWGGAWEIATGGLPWLQLAPDGVSPGFFAGGRPVVALRPDPGHYAPLAQYMSNLGWDVLAVPFDWRLSYPLTAASILAAALDRWSNQPFSIVAHSHGGLVARSVWLQMFQGGRDRQLTRMVLMGAPAYGCWEVVRVWYRQPWVYYAVYALMHSYYPQGIIAPDNTLDIVLASLPSFFELLPNRYQGPLALSDPATASRLYSAASYVGGNPYLRQASFDAGAGAQQALAEQYPAGRAIAVLGTGLSTPNGFNSLYSPYTENGYTKTTDGDSLITVANASLPGMPRAFLNECHENLPLNRTIWDALPWMIGSGLSSDVVLPQPRGAEGGFFLPPPVGASF